MNMVNKAILFLVSTLLMIGCGNTKKNDVKSNIENNWILSHISWVDDRDYLPDSYLQRYDSISEMMSKMTVAFDGDTIIINGKYKSHFIRKKVSTTKLFILPTRTGELQENIDLKSYFINRFNDFHVDVSDSLPYLQLTDSSGYSGFSFYDYALKINPGITYIGDTQSVCLIYEDCIGAWFINNATPVNNSIIKPSHYQLPYNERTDPEKTKYELLPKDKITQPDNPEYACYSVDNMIRYIPMPGKGNVSIMLVPCDGGDFPYRYYLYTLCGNKIVDGIYVEGEWWDSEGGITENTYFSIDENYNICVTTVQGAKQSIIYYTIDKSGNFLLSTSGTKGHKK